MNKPSSDIEALIWMVAESGDSKAVSDFEQRFPEYRGEMLRRLNMIQGLKGAKATRPPGIPRFKPRPKPRPQIRPVSIVIGVGLAGLAAASFLVTVNVLKPRQNESMANLQPIAHTSRFDPDELPAPTVPTPAPDTAPKIEAPYEKPITVHIERAPLQTILTAVGQQGGLTVQLAPGLPDPEIQADYSGVSAAEILQDLGERFGFTAFNEGEATILIVPAIDKTRGSGGFSSGVESPLAQ
jgi:hypothetical protein